MVTHQCWACVEMGRTMWTVLFVLIVTTVSSLQFADIQPGDTVNSVATLDDISQKSTTWRRSGQYTRDYRPKRLLS